MNKWFNLKMGFKKALMFLSILLIIGGVFLNGFVVSAQAPYPSLPFLTPTPKPTDIFTSDQGQLSAAAQLYKKQDSSMLSTVWGFLKEQANTAVTWAKDDLWKNVILAGGSKALGSAITNAINTIAIDTATWLGSGGNGQKPLFYTEGWGSYLTNVADNAAGTFVEELGKQNGYAKFNLCKPNFNLQMKIGLGLIKTVKPGTPACTFSKMVSNWENELTSENFMEKVQASFDPSGNDFGVAFSLQTGMFEKINNDKYEKIQTRQEGKGWLNEGTDSLMTKALGVPNAQERKLAKIDITSANSITTYTGYALVDAVNIFINTLASTAFDELMKKLGGKSSTSGYGNWSSLISNFSAGPDATIGGGITATKKQASKVMEPRFNVRGDYNILAELSSCPKPDKAGPTNCVIDEKFKQAILEKKTVAEAIKLGYLNGEKIVGFSANNMEPRYTDGYPYRSLLILRKFRILPVGWEIATQYIRDNIDPAAGGVGIKTLSDLINCYDPSDEYVGPSAAWCQGLVDPNWVLKAPQNYCRREGPGPENISGDDATIVRNDKYCGDEQSCIKEKDDGSCEYYGYCTEERRKWKFNTKSCEPMNNTCQTFKKEDGASASYLKNTLNYSGCSIDNAGCADYCTAFDFATGKYTCTAASVGDKVFLDRDAKVCDAKSEGCTSFIRTKDGIGANLLLNSSFEEDLAIGSWAALGATTSDAFSGLSSLQLTPGVLTKTFVAGPSIAYVGGEYSIEGEAYSISLYSKNCPAGSTVALNDGANTQSISIESAATWQQSSFTHVFMSSGPTFDFEFNTPAGSSCLIDAVKIEKNMGVSAYSEYGANGLINEKFAPNYLGCDGVADPAECKDFARSCKFEEVGCELYTPKNGNMPIPGKVKAGDYCVAECVGFDTYLQSETIFDSLRPSDFIPKTAKTCSAEVNGCDQFTNLDKLGSGAEATEYYSYLRQCITSGGAQFYTWEGSNEAGFQLKVVTLKADDDTHPWGPLDLDGNPATPNVADYIGDPAIVGNRLLEVAKCNESIYQLKQTDPGYNPDCREYYNSAGVKSYHLYSQTISEDTNCHPYRRTEVNIDPSITLAAACVGPDRNWTAAGECAVCINGGTWNVQQGACVYQAIPGQGVQCGAADNGCREYTGNTGQSVKILSNSDFEDTSLQGWVTHNGAPAPTLSTESINMGGHSIRVQTNAVNQGIRLPIASTTMEMGGSYAITLMARTNVPVNLRVRATNAAAANVNFVGIGALAGNWQMYRANLSEMTIIDAENLIIEADVAADFFVDNIKLTEITNRYYLVKNSWNTPETCNQDMNKLASPGYMLKCNEYKDRDNLTHYLRSFSYLCSEGSVGCELMVDIHNSTNPLQQTFNTAAAPVVDDVTVPADNYVYAVYDKKKLCKSEDVGCQRLGKPYIYQAERAYSDVYLKNNPDEYKTAMCNYDGLSCGEYLTESGPSYFKNPGDATCEWRPGPKNVYGWYKTKVKRCNAIGVICAQDKDCVSPQTCLTETADNACATDSSINPKTFGVGTGQRTLQPSSDVDGNWVGTCPTEDSTCGEFVDPKSTFNQNLIFNNDFAQNVNVADDPARDGWPGNVQGVTLEKNTLYVLAGTGNAGSTVTVSGCTANISRLDDVTNTLVGPMGVVTLSLGTSPTRTSLTFYSNNADKCNVTVAPAGVITNLNIELHKAVVDYQLAKDIDTTSCNGLVDNSMGCVLFNQRAQSGATILGLNYDADVSSSTPAVAAGIARDSNTLIKVSPDRTCNQWLACRSSVNMKDQDGNDKNICLDIGLCNQFDYKGGCGNFIEKNRVNQTFNYGLGGQVNSSQASNISGYVKVGKNQAGQIDAQIPLGSMTQVGASANVYNGNMEIVSENGYPTGWKFFNSTDPWDEKSFKIISSFANVQNEGVGKAPEGKAILKLGVKHEITSNSFTVKANESYVLQAIVNTTRIKGTNPGDRVHMLFVCDNNTATGNVIFDRTIEPGKTWHTVMTNNVLTPVGCTRATARFRVDDLAGVPLMEGNYYVDDVKVRPVLESRVAEYTPQSCRLYPKTEAMSCQFQETSGVRYNGWYGYCLEYDRYPGNNNACLLWWPAEKINGDPFSRENTFKGYDGKFPAYYCAELDGNYRYVEKRSADMIKHVSQRKSGTFFSIMNVFIAIQTLGISYAIDDDVMNVNQTIENGGPSCPIGKGYLAQTAFQDCNPGFFGRCNVHWWTYCIPASRKYKVSNAGQTNNEWSGGAWYQYNGSLINWKNINSVKVETETLNGVRILDMNTPTVGAAAANQDGILYRLVDPKDYDFLPCKRFYETVSNTGENKVWLGRLGEDSNYAPLGLGYKYSQDDTPFGSAVPPEPQSNPYEWDGNAKAGRQPVSFKLPQSKETRAGSPYDCVGDKCIKVGHCADSGNTCVDLSQNNLQIDRCNGSGLAAASVSGGSYATANDCYTSPGAMITPVDVYSTTCTRAGLNCAPVTQGTCSCANRATNLPAPQPANAIVCQVSGSGSVPTGLPGDPCDINGNVCDGDFCAPTICSLGAGANCQTTVLGTANSSVGPGAGAGDDLNWAGINSATTTGNITTFTPPSYGCAVNEACITTAMPDWPQASTHAAYTTNVSSIDNLKRMFAKNYGVWLWNTATRRYEKDLNPAENWDINNDPLAPNCASPRPGYPADYCRIVPTVTNVTPDRTTIRGGSMVKLTFNSRVDVNQLPLVYYRVDWGDGSSPTIVTGEFGDRPNAADPHVLYHYYSYTAVNGCAANPCPLISPSVQIMDNWGTESVNTFVPAALRISVWVN